MTLAGKSHVDPCRRCRDLVLRENLVPAKKVIIRGQTPKTNARGYYCRPCVKILK